MEYRIKISPGRRSVGLRVAPDGVIEIVAPVALPPEVISRLLYRHRRALANMLSAVKKFSFADGETFFYRGKSYPVSASQRLLCFTGELFLLPPGDDAARRAGLEKLYRRLAEQYILPRAAETAEKYGFKPEKLKISSAATRYGSCSASGVCRFSWRLIQYPDELIDLVIAHELSHLKVMNHSAGFYRELQRISPDFALLQQKMKLFSRNNRLL